VNSSRLEESWNHHGQQAQLAHARARPVCVRESFTHGISDKKKGEKKQTYKSIEAY